MDLNNWGWLELLRNIYSKTLEIQLVARISNIAFVIHKAKYSGYVATVIYWWPISTKSCHYSPSMILPSPQCPSSLSRTPPPPQWPLLPLNAPSSPSMAPPLNAPPPQWPLLLFNGSSSPSMACLPLNGPSSPSMACLPSMTPPPPQWSLFPSMASPHTTGVHHTLVWLE